MRGFKLFSIVGILTLVLGVVILVLSATGASQAG